MKIIWAQKLGNPECPYLTRWVFECWLFSIRIHLWHSSDDQRNFHDHPWDYLTFVGRGGYTDLNRKGKRVLNMFGVGLFRATHQHTVKVNKGGALTFMITGPERRQWGFWVKGKFRKRNKYFFEFGHHPCQ